MLKTSPAQRGWIAGVISCFGILGLTDTVHPDISLLIKSVKHPEMVKKMSQLTGVKLKKKKSGHEVEIVGPELYMLWPLISMDITYARQLEYNSLTDEVAKRSAAYDAKIAYQKERASDPLSTHDQLRRRAEALYKNDDPAVQVIDQGFIEADMAVEYDLDRARHERERAS
jgi:hypothetical protein